MQIRIDGPFSGSYSLALVNREMALALEALLPGAVSLSFECRPDPQKAYRPEPAFFEDHRREAELWWRGERMRAAGESPRVVLFNSWPPLVPVERFCDQKDGQRPLFLTNAYGWEESRFPPEHAAAFNRALDGLTVMSAFVAKTLADNGVFRPMIPVGLGADHILRTKPESGSEDLGAGYRFLHVSSCFPRKGLDVLLGAYGRAFTGADAVTLVVKTFPNPHNDAASQVADFRRHHPDPPAVVLIDRDLPPGRIVDLYRRCHCVVAPSRGEGFGLPLAEAMLLGLPVITTGFGGQMDFCHPATARLIDYRMQAARSHLNPFASVWAEPDPDHLARLLRAQFEEAPEVLAARTAAARKQIGERFTWQACARRLLDFITDLKERRVDRVKTSRPSRPRAALVTTWNTRCGIAEYSRQLLPPLLDELEIVILAPHFGDAIRTDEPNVHRIWWHHDFFYAIPRFLAAHRIGRILINFHFGFFSRPRFRNLLRRLRLMGVATTIVFHAIRTETMDVRPLVRELARVYRLLVHNVDDLNFFHALGLVHNSALLPHGVAGPKYRPRPSSMVLPAAFRRGGFIASFGFLMPHKGILELIRAFARLAPAHPQLCLLLLTSFYPKDEVLVYYRDCLAAISETGLAQRVGLVTDFLPAEDIRALLLRARLIVFPYQHSAESSSAAVRLGLASGAPTAVTPLPIFEDVGGVVHRLPGTTPADLARGIDRLLANPDQIAAKGEVQQRWLAVLQWPVVGKAIAGLINGAKPWPKVAQPFTRHRLD